MFAKDFVALGQWQKKRAPKTRAVLLAYWCRAGTACGGNERKERGALRYSATPPLDDTGTSQGRFGSGRSTVHTRIGRVPAIHSISSSTFSGARR